MSENQTDVALLERAMTAESHSVEITGQTNAGDDTMILQVRVERLEGAGNSQEDDNGESDAKESEMNSDATPSDPEPTNDSADATEGYERTLYEVGNAEIGFNRLQKAVSRSDMAYPSDQSAENLADCLREHLSTTETTLSDLIPSMSNESDSSPDDGGPDAGGNDTEPAHPEETNSATVENYRYHYGECAGKDCEKGCRDESAALCYQCQKSDSLTVEPESFKDWYNNLDSAGQKSAEKLMEEENMEPAEILEKV